MRKFFGKLALAVLLLLPYRRDENEDGGHTWRAVLYEVDCTEQDGEKQYRISVLKFFERQIALLKSYFGK